MSKWYRSAWVVLLFVTGCASTAPIRYTVSRQLTRQAPLSSHVVVGIFRDDRPASERIWHDVQAWSDLQTSDKNFKPEVAKQIAESLARHLEQVGLFQNVAIHDIGNALDQDPQALQALAQQDVDLAITGKLTHFVGSQSATNAAGMAFGALGALMEAVANPKSVHGYVEFSDLKIINVKQQRVLWQGTVNHEFDRKDVLYKGPVSYALEALKEVNGKVVIKLNELL